MTVEHTRNFLNEDVPPPLARKILLEWANLPGDPVPTDEDFAKLIKACPRIFQDKLGVELAEGERAWIIGIRAHLRKAWNAPSKETREWFIFKVRDLYANAVRRTGEPIDHADKGLVVNPEFINCSNVNDLYAAMAAGKQLFIKRPPGFTGRIANPFSLLHAAFLLTQVSELGMLPDSPPPETFFDNVMRYFLSISHKALYCTRDGCQTPYFIKGKGVRTQRYCKDCGLAVRRERQKKYWDEAGKDLRQNRRRKSKQRKRK